MSRWNPEDLKRLISEHTVSGYKVMVPIFGQGKIDKMIRPSKGGLIFYKVTARQPMAFSVFAKHMKVSSKPLSMEDWRKLVKGSGSFPAMAYDLRERLERSEKVSQADVLFRELMDRGCVDLENKVFCYTFPSEDVFMYHPEPGQLVEVVDGKHGGPSGWPGVFLKYENVERAKGALSIVQEFTPVPYMRTPEALLPAAVKKSYTMPITWTLGYGLAHALEDVGPGLPPGTLSQDKLDYVLEKPIPLSEIEAFCENPNTWKELRQEKNIYCLQQAMMLHTLPLITEEVSFRPLPEGIPPEDVVVSITEPDEPESEHVSWPEED